LVVESWFLRALFWGVKIFLGFEIYFWAVAISRMVRGKTNAKDAEGNAKDAKETFARWRCTCLGMLKSSALIRKDAESSCDWGGAFYLPGLKIFWRSGLLVELEDFDFYQLGDG
jgi:hypothetical protein